MGINPAKSIGHVATAAGKGLKQTTKTVSGGVSRVGKKAAEVTQNEVSPALQDGASKAMQAANQLTTIYCNQCRHSA